MGRELQKKKNRSSINKVRPKKKINPRVHRVKKFGNQIIAQNWNKKETLLQNYKRLGLAVKLNAATGGVEKSLSTSNIATAPTIAPTIALAPNEARIERDENGKIINIIYGKSGSERLDALEEAAAANSLTPMALDPMDTTTPVVKALIERAARGVKAERSQSEREKEWVERLVEKYGDDYKRMAWDRKLNPFQQSEGDIRKRVMKWKMKQEKGAAT
ncbi:ribosome biogenesis protein Nop16 [Kalaharituber pfeilii]|nr:ribosome biogenesis protein Nop16 [Kalaharituber pfeilii]